MCFKASLQEEWEGGEFHHFLGTILLPPQEIIWTIYLCTSIHPLDPYPNDDFHGMTIIILHVCRTSVRLLPTHL